MGFTKCSSNSNRRFENGFIETIPEFPELWSEVLESLVATYMIEK